MANNNTKYLNRDLNVEHELELGWEVIVTTIIYSQPSYNT